MCEFLSVANRWMRLCVWLKKKKKKEKENTSSQPRERSEKKIDLIIFPILPSSFSIPLTAMFDRIALVMIVISEGKIEWWIYMRSVNLMEADRAWSSNDVDSFPS